MENENIPLDVPTIRAAVVGEAWAVEKVIEYYSDEINRLCTKMETQPDGRIKKTVDEDIRQSLILSLIEALPKFEAEI